MLKKIKLSKVMAANFNVGKIYIAVESMDGCNISEEVIIAFLK